MPLKVGTESVVRLYKREGVPVLKYRKNNIGSCPGIVMTVNYDPNGWSCDSEGEMLYSSDTGSCYICREETEHFDTEVTHLKTTTEDIHKRVTITFDADGGSAVPSQTRTWGVENVTQPPNPTRTGYTFKGWAAYPGATTPNITFPFLAPRYDATRYAVWEQTAQQTTAPTVGTPFCIIINGTNFIQVAIANNDNETAIIKNDNYTIGTLAPGASSGFNLDSGFSTPGIMTPYNYNYTITATATGKNQSTGVIKSGAIRICQV